MITIPQPQAGIIPLYGRPAWKALQQHYAKVQSVHLRQMFAEDPQCAERFAFEAVGLYFDYSKNRITDETVRLLLELANQSGLRERIDAMFSGEKINVTEKRAVLHVALRATKDESIMVEGKNVVPRSPRRARSDDGICESGPQRPMERAYRQARTQRDQHWYRRLRSRPRHGLRGAEVLQPAQHDVPLHLERGQHGLCRGYARPKCRRDSLHRVLQDVHNA